jgi:hypothetical protein
MKELDPAWEAVAAVSTVILVNSTKGQFSNIPPSVKWVHFGIVAVYSLVGISGPRFLLMFTFGHGQFVRMFSQPSALGVAPTLMQWLAAVFGLVGTVFFVDVMRLGRLRRKSRTMFNYLVLPCSLVYPVVMVTASGAITAVPAAKVFALSAAAVLLALGSFAIVFYESKSRWSDQWRG